MGILATLRPAGCWLQRPGGGGGPPYPLRPYEYAQYKWLYWVYKNAQYM
jgi:hypothetical protein